MKPSPPLRRPGRRRLLVLAASAGLIATLLLAHIRGTPIQSNKQVLENVAPSGLFACPDGRLGLHVVHTRFLVNQATANPVFVASRLQLMNNFMIPSLMAQKSRNFALVVSHDPALPKPTVSAVQDAVRQIGVPTLFLPSNEITGMGMTLAKLRQHFIPDIPSVDLFISTRLDIDDAVNTGAAQAIQSFACSVHPRGTENDQNLNNSTSTTTATNNTLPEKVGVKLVYIQDGLVWFPSLTEMPYGEIRTPRVNVKIYRVLALMQSLVIAKPDALGKNCKLDVYAFPHYKPSDFEAVRPEKLNCSKGAFTFNVTSDICLWEPPKGEYGWLYTKTGSSWTAGKINHKTTSLKADIDVAAVQASFGVEAGALAVMNLLFGGLQSHVPGLLENSTKLQLE